MTNRFDRDDVIKVCNYTLALINANRNADREDLIVQEMNKRKFFFGEKFTREEAIKRLDDGDSLSEWNTIDWHYEGREILCKYLLIIADRIITDYINLSLEQVQYLNWSRIPNAKSTE